jgi:phage tail sheath protein FI
LGDSGTLPLAIDGIFDQAGALVVVIRVAEGADKAKTKSNIIGGVDAATGKRKGIQVLLDANAVVKVQPRILIAPEFSQEQAVLTELDSIAHRLRAVVIADGPNTNDADAISYRQKFGSKRIMIVDPWVKVWDTKTSKEINQPASSRVAGEIVQSDNERGFWFSPSNREINGITGTVRAIDFTLGDVNSRANLLNEKQVTTIVQQDGYRTWGNRTCSSDVKWAFLSVVRTADLIEDSIQRAHLWAVDRNITKNYVDAVLDGVNGYLAHLVAIGALIGAEAWADESLNTATQIKAGKVTFDFKFTPPYPAEHITFRSHLVDDYIKEIFK